MYFSQVHIAGYIFVVYRDVFPLKRYFLPNFKKRNPTEIRLTVFNTNIDLCQLGLIRILKAWIYCFIRKFDGFKERLNSEVEI